MDDIEKAITEYKRQLDSEANQVERASVRAEPRHQAGQKKKTSLGWRYPKPYELPLDEPEIDQGDVDDQIVRKVDFGGVSAKNQSSKRVSSTIKLPLLELRRKGFITPRSARNRLTEEYRHIKRQLFKRINTLKDSDEENVHHNVIAVTSAISGEGKTFTSINLAMSLALERERTVMLIDSDIVRHSAGRIFGLGGDTPGLIDMLEDESLTPSDVILRTNVERLVYIPAGKKSSSSNELLSGESMKKLIAELSSRYEDRIIVLDCPPVLQTNEASILADHAGQVVFVVAAESTSQRVVNQALKDIGDESKVSILLNKSRKRFGNYAHYGYDYS